jgi:hypothetical protein
MELGGSRDLVWWPLARVCNFGWKVDICQDEVRDGMKNVTSRRVHLPDKAPIVPQRLGDEYLYGQKFAHLVE